MSIENIKSKSGVSPIVNVRIPREDMEIIRTAARGKSLSYSAFIRMAAVEVAKAVNAESISAS